MNYFCVIPRCHSVRLLLAIVAFVLLTPLLTAQIIVTAAGGWVGDGGPATKAGFVYLRGLARDSSGNLYVSELWGNRVRKISPSGIITTIAGNGTPGYSGDGGPAAAATLASPADLVIDPQGNLLIADAANGRIRKIDKKGIITTIAGNGTLGYTGDGGRAIDAELDQMRGLAFDAAGNLFICDIVHHVVRKVDAGGFITTVAGNGTMGFSGDGGPAIYASLNTPIHALPDGQGNLYISDLSNYRVRKVDKDGYITTIAGQPDSSLGYGDGGPATQAWIGSPRGLAFDLTGGLLIAATGGQRIRRVELSSGIIATVAGKGTGFNGDGLAAAATRLQGPYYMLLDPAGNLLFTDTGSDRLRKIDASSGIVSTIAGGYVGDGNLATSASLNVPSHPALDQAGNLYIADTNDYRIRKVDTKGIITSFAGNGMSGYAGDGGPAPLANLGPTYGVTADPQGNVFFYDQWNQSIRRVDPLGVISTFYQAPDYYFYTSSMAMDAAFNFYFGDQYYCVVRKIDRFGTMSVVAGTEGWCDYNGDGMPATSAYLVDPNSVTLDSAGNLYIADVENNRIRKVDATTGMISTVAGNGNCDFTGDGGLATAATLCSPYGVAVDSKGNIYIADFNNLRIRQVDPAGIIRTIAGTGLQGSTGDGGSPLNASFDFVQQLAVNSWGDLYVADGISRVRKIAQPRSLYLHASQKILSLDYNPPTARAAKSRDSGALAFRGGNPWQTLATWNAAASLTRGTLYELKDLHVWLGVSVKADRKANFDLRAELYKNGVRVAAGETYCISGLSEDADLAREATVSFASFPHVSWDGAKDVLSLRLLARIGTNGSGSACGGNAKASGLEVYFNASKQPAQFAVTIP